MNKKIKIGAFALIVVTTASLEKIILETRVKYYKEHYMSIKNLLQYSTEILERFKERLKKK